MTHLNYDDLAQRAVDGGFTVDLNGDTPTSGYAVGSRPDRTRRLNLRMMNARDVADEIYVYVVDNGYELREGYYLGAWTDDGTLYLDLVTVTPDQGSAMQLGRALGEIAVYNLATHQTIQTAEPVTDLEDPVRGNQSKHAGADGTLRYDADDSEVFPGATGVRQPYGSRERALDEHDAEINHDPWGLYDAEARAAQWDDDPNPYHGDYSEE